MTILYVTVLCPAPSPLLTSKYTVLSFIPALYNKFIYYSAGSNVCFVLYRSNSESTLTYVR